MEAWKVSLKAMLPQSNIIKSRLRKDGHDKEVSAAHNRDGGKAKGERHAVPRMSAKVMCRKATSCHANIAANR